jgi:hypothetical protein
VQRHCEARDISAIKDYLGRSKDLVKNGRSRIGEHFLVQPQQLKQLVHLQNFTMLTDRTFVWLIPTDWGNNHRSDRHEASWESKRQRRDALASPHLGRLRLKNSWRKRRYDGQRELEEINVACPDKVAVWVVRLTLVDWKIVLKGFSIIL